MEKVDMTQDDTDTHSKENTMEVLKTIRDFLKDDEENGLEAYDAVTEKGTTLSFKVTNFETDLDYMIHVEPVD